MNRLRVWTVGLLLTLVFAPSLRAQETRNVQLTDLSGAKAYNGVYVGPYGFQVEGLGGTWDFVCVDYLHEIHKYDSYDAYFTPLNGSSLSTTKQLGTLDDYRMAAYLSTQFTGDAAQYWTVHSTIWSTMSNEVGSLPTSVTSSQDASLESGYSTWAAGQNWNNWKVVTEVYDPLLDGRQEFVTYIPVPEPATAALLLAGALGLVAVGWKRRTSRLVDSEVEA